MKKFLGTLLITATVTVQAGTLEEAQALWSARGDDARNALAAANIYNELANTRTDNKEKAQMKIAESKALFYYTGNHLTRKKDKLKSYIKGYETADVAVNLMANATSAEDKTILATALYNYSANLGKWGETKGVIQSLFKWPELKAKSFEIIANDETVNHYGAYRVLGKGYMKVPSENSSEGYAFIEKAYNSTVIEIEGVETSSHAGNHAYIVWASHKEENADQFCETYQNALDVKDELDANPELYNEFYPGLQPETKTEFEDIANEEDYSEFYEENC